MARTFEYEIRPRRSASEIFGNVANACATRTYSRAVDQQLVDGGVDASREFGDFMRQAVALVAAPVALVRVRHWLARRRVGRMT